MHLVYKSIAAHAFCDKRPRLSEGPTRHFETRILRPTLLVSEQLREKTNVFVNVLDPPCRSEKTVHKEYKNSIG